MFYSVRGNLLYSDPAVAVVEAGGVGYKLLISTQTYSKLPKTGREVFLYTYLQVREDAVDLFGFFEEHELSFFKMLIGVNGVGPKAALAILSEATPEKLSLFISTGDVKSITKAQGVGPKLAQRIVLELKDKIAPPDIAKGISQTSGGELPMDSSSASEAISALMALGYAQSQAVMAVSKLPPDGSVQELIKGALKLLAQG